MAKLTKRQQALASKVDRNKFYSLDEALTHAKETATAKFGLRTNVLMILDFLGDVINARKAKTR